MSVAQKIFIFNLIYCTIYAQWSLHGNVLCSVATLRLSRYNCISIAIFAALGFAALKCERAGRTCNKMCTAQNKQNTRMSRRSEYREVKGVTRGGAKSPEDPPLATSKLRIRIKYPIDLIFFVFQWSEVAWFGQLMILKIDYNILWHHKDYATENTSSKWPHKMLLFSSPSLSEVLVVPAWNWNWNQGASCKVYKILFNAFFALLPQSCSLLSFNWSLL